MSIHEAMAVRFTVAAAIVHPSRSASWKNERTFGWLEWNGILSKAYEHTTESSESNIYLASIRLMLQRLTFWPN